MSEKQPVVVLNAEAIKAYNKALAQICAQIKAVPIKGNVFKLEFRLIEKLCRTCKHYAHETLLTEHEVCTHELTDFCNTDAFNSCEFWEAREE